MTNLKKNLYNVARILEFCEHKELTQNAHNFMSLYEEIKRNLKKFVNDDRHRLEFNSEDLIFICTHCESVLAKYSPKININSMLEDAKKQMEEKGDISEFNKTCAENMHIVIKLTQFHAAMCYMATLQNLLEIEYEQGELGGVLLDCIKGFLKE